MDVLADCMKGEVGIQDDEESIIIRSNNTGVEECRLVNALAQQIKLRYENNNWKISRYDDGIAIMRMDTDRPFGPIFLVWMEDIDSMTTPFGAGIFKVFPRDLIPDARNTQFSLEY
jgi:hypothetical protein